MAGDWFQADDDAPEKPEVQQIMSQAGCGVELVLGRLWLLWRWVDRHADADDQLPGGGILRWMGITELCRECTGDETFWHAVAGVGWLTFSDRGVLIPRFDARFPESAKKRALEARRKRIDRLQKQLDAEQEPPRRRARRGKSQAETTTATESSADTIDLNEGAQRLQASVFEALTLPMLSDTLKLLEWWTWACGQPRPVGEDSPFFQERLLAAAERALRYSTGDAKSPIKNPVGFVASVMGFKQWVKLEPDDMQRGKTRLQMAEKRSEQRSDHLRDCIQSAPTSGTKRALDEQWRLAGEKFGVKRRQA